MFPLPCTLPSLNSPPGFTIQVHMFLLFLHVRADDQEFGVVVESFLQAASYCNDMITTRSSRCLEHRDSSILSCYQSLVANISMIMPTLMFSR